MRDELDPTAAYHEAGHAFLAHQLGGRVLEVSLELDESDEQGRTSVQWPRAPQVEQRRRSALVALAGPLAELHFRGEIDQLDTLAAWRADWREVQQALASSREPDPKRQLHRWLAEVRFELTDPANWERVCRIADALEAHGTLDADLLEDLLPTASDEGEEEDDDGSLDEVAADDSDDAEDAEDD